MSNAEAVVEVFKVVATIAIPFIAYLNLKTRTDLDRFAASQRAEKTGEPYESQIRKRAYHRLFKQKEPPKNVAVSQPETTSKIEAEKGEELI